MVATTYVWVLDQKVVATRSIYTVEASNEDQALLMDIRKKDMTNNITIVLTFMMIEPLNWSPSVCVKQTSNSGAVITNSAAVITNSLTVITNSLAVITNSPAVTF